MKQALLVIDVQNDYFKGGEMPLVNPQAALHKINQLEHYFLQHELPIIYIQHIKTQDFFVRGTPGVELHPALQVDAQSIIIEKQYPNSFFNTNLQTILETLNVHQVVITGMMTHMCVDATTRAAHELGYLPIVIAEATATKDLNFCQEYVAAKDVQLSILAALQTVAQVVLISEFISND